MLMFPRKSVAVRKFERKSTSSKVATGFSFPSKKRNRPRTRLTRRTSGVKAAGLIVSVGMGVEGTIAEEVFVSETFSMEGSDVCATGSTFVAATRGGSFFFGGEIFASDSGGEEGSRHLPSAFCAQNTSGSISEISLMTRG